MIKLTALAVSAMLPIAPTFVEQMKPVEEAKIHYVELTEYERRILRDKPSIKKADWYLDSWVRHKIITDKEA